MQIQCTIALVSDAHKAKCVVPKSLSLCNDKKTCYNTFAAYAVLTYVWSAITRGTKIYNQPIDVQFL